MLHLDIPTPADLAMLAHDRGDIRVALYLPTTPLTQDTPADRLTLKNMMKEVDRQLTEAGADKRKMAALNELVDDLIDDDEFWAFQARSLAILLSPERVQTFRLPNALKALVAVSDRYHLTPLMRAVTFGNAAYVLALAEGGVRLIHVHAELPPERVRVEGLPKDAASAVHRASVGDRSPSGRLHGSEGEKVLLRQFARKVDAALRPFLQGSDLPVILAADDKLAAIFRSVTTLRRLLPQVIDGAPEALSDAELADRARAVLDEAHRAELAGWRSVFEARGAEGRAATDLAQVARAATFGAVDSLLVDIDADVEGLVSDADGTLSFAATADATHYGIVDEIAARVLAHGGRVFAVRAADIPGGGRLAAVLRYAV